MKSGWSGPGIIDKDGFDGLSARRILGDYRPGQGESLSSA